MTRYIYYELNNGYTDIDNYILYKGYYYHKDDIKSAFNILLEAGDLYSKTNQHKKHSEFNNIRYRLYRLINDSQLALNKGNNDIETLLDLNERYIRIIETI